MGEWEGKRTGDTEYRVPRKGGAQKDTHHDDYMKETSLTVLALAFENDAGHPFRVGMLFPPNDQMFPRPLLLLLLPPPLLLPLALALDACCWGC